MSSNINEIWVAVAREELKEFGQTMRRITETNVFPYVLSQHGFKKINDSLYEKQDKQLIRIYQQDGKWQYQNLRNINDTGSLIQFIANRLNTEDPVISKVPAQLFLASKIAKAYHKDYIKSLRADYVTKLLQQPAIVNRGRRL